MGDEWRESAACAGIDTDVFFPVAADHRVDPAWAAALAVCERCPVTAECFADAVETGELEFGVRGGLTPRERRRALRPRRKQRSW